MHNHQDVEQGAQEHALAHQMRSIRRRWIHFVFRRTVLLLMVPHAAVLVMSLYFYLITLDNVLNSLLITSAIACVLILYAHLTSVDFTKGEYKSRFNLVIIFVLVSAFLQGVLLLSAISDDHPYLTMAFIFILTMLVDLSFEQLVIIAQLIFGGRDGQFGLAQGDLAARLLALCITFIYLGVMANVLIAKNVKSTFVDELIRYLKSTV